MALKKRFAAKLIVATTALAAGGVGVYAFTSGNRAPWAWFAGNDSAVTSASKLRIDNAPQSSDGATSNLDAVANAWVETTAPVNATPIEASPSARSAGITLARAESDASSPVGDRYRVQPLAATDGESTATSAPVETDAENGGTSVPSSAPPSADVVVSIDGSNSDRPAREDVAPAEPTIARGQDPPDATDVGAEVVAIQDLESSNPTSSNLEAGALRFPAEATNTAPARGAAAARARQAFAELPPAAASDRYSATATAARSGDATAVRAGGVVNPFATSTAQPPAAIRGESQALHTNLTSPPAGNATSPGAAGGPSAYDRSPEGGRFAPIDFRGAASGYGPQAGLPPSNAATRPGGDAFSPNAEKASGPEGAGRPGERAREGAQNPALVIQKVAPAEVQVNKPAKFVIQLRNVGGQAATDVVIQDQVPKGTRLLSTSPPAEDNGGKLTWRVGTLSIGEERSIEMQLMPVAEGEIGSVATVSYSAQASVKTRSTMPQLAIRMTSSKQVMVGQEHRVKIFLHNPGTGDATGVMLFENVPENVRHAAGAALEFEIGTLRAGETRELELVLHAEKPGKVKNVLSARAEGNLQVQQDVDFEVIAPALTVAVVGPERRYLERPATYAVRVENPGTAPARDIQLVTKLPKGMKFVRANNMGEYDAGTHAVYWSLAELPEGEHGSVELVAMPIETGSQTLEVEGRAQQGLSDQAKHPILVEGLAAIMFEVRDLEDPIEVGRETGYEIRVINQGTKAATNVQVSVALPQGMQVISAEGETRHTTQPNGIVFAPIRQLAPKADTVYRLKVLCQKPGDQRVIVEVKTDDMQPIRREESTRVFGDE